MLQPLSLKNSAVKQMDSYRQETSKPPGFKMAAGQWSWKDSSNPWCLSAKPRIPQVLFLGRPRLSVAHLRPIRMLILSQLKISIEIRSALGITTASKKHIFSYKSPSQGWEIRIFWLMKTINSCQCHRWGSVTWVTLVSSSYFQGRAPYLPRKSCQSHYNQRGRMILGLGFPKTPHSHKQQA